MKRQTLTLRFSLVILLVVCIEGLPNPHPARNGKIVGSRNADDGEFPYQVSVQFFDDMDFDFSHKCGGAIIDNTHFLTDADCVKGSSSRDLESFQVVAGVLDLSDKMDPARVTLEFDEVCLHPEFDPDNLSNNIAVVRVKGEFPLDGVSTDSIPLMSKYMDTPMTCTISGWGNTCKPPEYYPDILQAVDMPIVPQDACIKSYNNFQYHILPGMICAGYPEGGRDQCDGDSGSPLVCDGQLVGLGSWGNGCGLPSYPGVYSDIPYYYNWIMETISLSENQKNMPSKS